MSEVLYERRGTVGVLTLNRPEKLNALTHAMGAALQDTVQAINADSSVRAVVLCGQGRAFSAGGDLAFLRANAARSYAENQRGMRAFYAQFLSVRQIEVPTIAALQGRATGAGLMLALACDLRVAEEEAKVSANFVRVGLNPGMGGTYLLERLIGPSRAAELIYTGRDVLMGEALAIGLVNHVVQADRLLETALALAERIAANAPIALKLAKAMMSDESRTLEQALDREADGQATCFTSADLLEGIMAIDERRMPQFEGR